MSKYRTWVGIQTVASASIGEIEFDTIEEYYEKAYALWDSQDCNSPSVNISNDFDLSDWDLSEVDEDDLPYMLNKED
tara:strand:+ start:2149 stop:2379 length:231 start_codon:yes stop_codon:yes gene_type:complete